MERARKYELTFDRCRDYVAVQIQTEKIEHLKVLDYLSEIAATSAKWHARSLLITRDVPMVLAYDEMLDSWGVFLNTHTQMRIALVNPYPEIEKPLRQLISTADERRVKAAYFDDAAAAKRWMSV